MEEKVDFDAIRKQADLYYDVDEYGKALELYLKLADQNDAEVLRRIGFCYNSQKDYKKTVEWWLKAANMGNARAQRNMGNCYNNGEGVPQDYKKAAEWYTKAAEQGDAPAQLNLGNRFINGEGVEQDYKKAVEWYTKAAEQGNRIAINNLGACYIDGIGVERDAKKAVELYTKSAELGCVLAQRNLAGCYKNGTGVERNYDTAEYWYKKAAEQGDEDAKKALNDMYENGLVIPADAPRCHDADFGELAYAGKKGWKGKITANFSGKETELAIELEGTKDDKVTDAQRKAYAEYKVKESDFFKAMIAKAKELYKDVDVIYPKTLFIDRQGNYGWMGPKTVILSDGDVQFAASNNVLYNYADVIANRTKKEWYEWDTIYLNLLGELDAYSVERDDYRVDEYEDEDIRNGKLTEQEVDLLLWLTNEYDTSRIADRVLNYCNAHYESACYYDKEKKEYVNFELIEKTDLFKEVSLSSVRLMTKLAEDTCSPDMAIVGECGCDPDHGIAICFCEKAFDGICSHADVL
ncbi:MAG: sel1 repeat family protein [Paludibacteraceae bacterium]|nr:sel1 repeat family protein [Paludibacteraceae bacterium]